MKSSDLRLRISKKRPYVRRKRRISGYVSESIHYQTKQSHTAVLLAAPLLLADAMQAKQDPLTDTVAKLAQTDEKRQQDS